MQNYRLWWHKPQLHAEGDQAKRVTYLELFFDLIFVVVIARLAHHLTLHPDWGGVRDFVMLFLPVWWVWIGITYYNERFETYDLSFRLFTFLQLVAVAGMAANAEYGLSKTAMGFALAYASARLIITLMWWRAGRHNPELRPITTTFVAGFSLSIVLWMVSAFLTGPLALLLKGLGLAIDLLTPVPTLRHQRRLFSASARKLPERFGLFVIIVLGESLVGVVNGLADVARLGPVTLVHFGLALALGFGLWWIYFDFIGRREPQPDTLRLFAWSYLHLPLVLGIVMTSAMTEHAVTFGAQGGTDGVRWILAAGFALYYLAVAGLEFTVEHERLLPTGFITALRIGTAAAALLTPLLPVPLGVQVALLVALHAVHMVIGVRAWFRSEHAGRSDVH